MKEAAVASNVTKITKVSFWSALHERTFRIPLATFAVIFLLLGICGNDTMVFYGPTIAAQVEDLP